MTNDHGFAPTQKMLSPTTLAEMLDISERHLTDVRREDTTFPAPVMLRTLPRWSPSAIHRWMDRDRVSTDHVARDVPTDTVALPADVRRGAKKVKGAQRVH